MAESMKDYETELEASFKKIEEGDILTGTVISVDEKEVVVDLKYYAEGIIPAEDYSREPGFSLKEQVNVGDEVSAIVVSKDDGNGNILLSRTEAADVLAWDKLKELKDSKEVIDVVVKGIVNGGVIAYVEGVRGFIPASKLALNYVEDTNEYLNKPIQTGEPVAMALRKCPNLVIVPSDFELYDKCSRAFKAICASFAPVMESFSIDEVFLDITWTSYI